MKNLLSSIKHSENNQIVAPSVPTAKVGMLSLHITTETISNKIPGSLVRSKFKLGLSHGKFNYSIKQSLLGNQNNQIICKQK